MNNLFALANELLFYRFLIDFFIVKWGDEYLRS